MLHFSSSRYWLYGMNLQEKWETTESLKRMASFTWIQTSCFWTWAVWWNTTALTSYPAMTAWSSGVLMVTPSQGDRTAMAHWHPTAPGDRAPAAVGHPAVYTHKQTLFPPFILTWIVIQMPFNELLVKPFSPDQRILWSFLLQRSELILLWKLPRIPTPFIKLLLLLISLECRRWTQRNDLNTDDPENGHFWKYVRIYLWQGILILWLGGTALKVSIGAQLRYFVLLVYLMCK